MLNPLERQQILDDIFDWCAARPDIRALGVVGSGARTETPADPWSDWDLLLIAEDPHAYLASDAWAEAISPVWVSTVERGGQGEVVERRVLFRCGVDADFIVLPTGDASVFESEPLASIIARGLRILLDHDRQLAPLLTRVRGEPPAHPPSAAEFSELVNDFLFHTVWAAKKLCRGELWSAKTCCDGYMKRHLLTMIAWHTGAQRGWQTNTWYGGRFLERWAPPEALAGLTTCFARYAEPEVWQALAQTSALFDRLAIETAQSLGYPYPQELAHQLREQVERIRIS
jgi:aminoglycoside 6-adenylyltransferase